MIYSKMSMIGESMQKIVINHWMNIIKKCNNYDNIKLEEIKYGLTGLYMTISKLIVILLISLILKITKNTLILLVLFNIIRLTSFGIHAKKSWICLISSIIIFICFPILLNLFHSNLFFRIIVGAINVIHIFIYSPADTKKRPIVSLKRRKVYKYISTSIAITFVIVSLIINNYYIQNSLIFVLIIQNILISPITYKILKEPYNNYTKYLKTSA